MNENIIPEIAEAKSAITNRVNTKTIIQREVSAFVGFAETIEEQNSIIAEQKNIIINQQKQIVSLEAKERRLLDQERQLIKDLNSTRFELLNKTSNYKAQISNLESELKWQRATREVLYEKAQKLERLESRLSDQTAAFNRIKAEVDSFYKHHLKK